MAKCFVFKNLDGVVRGDVQALAKIEARFREGTSGRSYSNLLRIRYRNVLRNSRLLLRTGALQHSDCELPLWLQEFHAIEQLHYARQVQAGLVPSVPSFNT